MASFSSNSGRNDTPLPEPSRRRGEPAAISIIGKDMAITGDLETEGMIKIEGTVRGAVRAGTQILVAQGATIEGDLHTREAVIGGMVHGTIHAQERVEVMAGQRAVVRDLVEAYLEDPVGRLDPELLADWKAADSDAAALRVVIDQVASLTDVRALHLHAAWS